MISDETLERVLDAANIVEIVGEWVKLKKMGADYRGPCPFHNGKGPNFSVVPGKNFYHCFVCGESGDVVTFVRKKTGTDFVGAVKYIGEKVGIEVIDVPKRAQPIDPNAKHWEVLASAAEWFRTQLKDPQTGRDALQYLHGRGLDADAIDRFELGYAPRDGQALRKHLQTLGFDDQRQLDAGILKPASDGREARCSFRDRVMFPIVDERGNYVAFGGRAMGDATPKYLNSAASDVYHKGETLYHMHRAKLAMRREHRAVVVEGYMDAIRVALSGVECVVAPLGTALTEEQAKLIVRYAPEVFLLYDSDKAGQTATFKSGLALLREGATVRVVTLPAGEDPDTFVRAKGRTALEEHFDQAMDVFDRQVQLVDRKGMFRDISQQRIAIDLLLPTIRAAKDPLTKEMYLTRLAEKTGLDKSVLLKEAQAPESVTRRGRQSGNEAGPRSAQTRNGPPSYDDGYQPSDEPADGKKWNGEGKSGAPRKPWEPRGQWKGKKLTPSERWKSSWVPPVARDPQPEERALIMAMLAERGLVERIAERHGPGDFRDPRYSALFRVLLMAGPDEGLDQIAERLDDFSANTLHELVERQDGRNPEAIDVALNLAKLDARPIEQRLEAIKREMGNASTERQVELQVEEQELTKERNKILPVRAPGAKPRY
ncbi:MAG: DNA primase [Gemmatimonas sp.]